MTSGSKGDNKGDETMNETRRNTPASSAASLRERAAETFHACLPPPRPLVNPNLKERVDRVNALAQLYFNRHVPLWPPRLLLQKAVRKAMYPLLWPQVLFNESVRDCVIELRATVEHEFNAAHDAAQKVRDLEAKIELLEAQLHDVTEQVGLLNPFLPLAERERAASSDGAERR